MCQKGTQLAKRLQNIENSIGFTVKPQKSRFLRISARALNVQGAVKIVLSLGFGRHSHRTKIFGSSGDDMSKSRLLETTIKQMEFCIFCRPLANLTYVWTSNLPGDHKSVKIPLVLQSGSKSQDFDMSPPELPKRRVLSKSCPRSRLADILID